MSGKLRVNVLHDSVMLLACEHFKGQLKNVTKCIIFIGLQKKTLIQLHKISLKQTTQDQRLALLESHGINHGREETSGSTALTKNMSEFFPIDEKQKTMETLEEKLKNNKKFFNCLVSIPFLCR